MCVVILGTATNVQQITERYIPTRVSYQIKTNKNYFEWYLLLTAADLF